MLLDPTTWLIPQKKTRMGTSLSVSLSLPLFSIRPNSQPSNSTQKLPKATPLSPPLHPSDPVSTPSLKQITPWPTSSFRTTLACAWASQNYASVFALRFRGISSVRLVTEKSCWQYKIPCINNKRTEDWRFFCILCVASVCLIVLKTVLQGQHCLLSWPSLNRIFAITIILICRFLWFLVG